MTQPAQVRAKNWPALAVQKSLLSCEIGSASDQPNTSSGTSKGILTTVPHIYMTSEYLHNEIVSEVRGTEGASLHESNVTRESPSEADVFHRTLYSVSVRLG